MSAPAVTLALAADRLDAWLTGTCASCGESATTTVILRGITTPTCLRHYYNHWRTPPPHIAAMRGVAVPLAAWLRHDESAYRFGWELGETPGINEAAAAVAQAVLDATGGTP